MNRAVLRFTLLLKLSQISKFEWALCTLLFLGFIAAAAAKSDFAPILEVFTNPATLLVTGYTFARDSALNQESRSDGEYFALLFSRPVTRPSYVLTKSVVTAVGILVTVGTILVLMLVAQLLMGCSEIIFLDAHKALSLVASAWSFGCLMVFLRALPSKISNIAFVIFIYACAGGALLSYGVKLNDDIPISNPATIITWEIMCDTLQQFFYPAIDTEAIANATTFSFVPLVSYTSNCLLYLLGATVLLNRREFSYAES